MLRQRGLTLIELVLFIVLTAIAFGALTLAISNFTRHSPEALTRKQALAIAESLLDEIELMPSTYCDAEDANVATATSSAGCATLPEAMGPETEPGGTETRYSTTVPFDNVNDYNGFTMPAPPGIKDITGTVVGGLSGYSASVSEAQAALGGIAASEVLKITVTVTAPDGTTMSLDGFRTRYAPNTAP